MTIDASRPARPTRWIASLLTLALAACSGSDGAALTTSTASVASVASSPASTEITATDPSAVETSAPATAVTDATQVGDTTAPTASTGPVSAEPISDAELARYANGAALLDDTGVMSVENALAAFANVVEPLPGVTPWPGELDWSVGPVALEILQWHRDELTPQQQAIVDLNTPERGDPVDPWGDPGDGPPRVSHGRPSTVPPEYMDALQRAARFLAGHLTWEIPRDTLTMSLRPPFDAAGHPNFIGPEGARTTGVFSPGGDYVGCDLSFNSARVVGAAIDGYVVHELFHCYQKAIHPTMDGLPAIIEGSAAWVEQEYTGTSSYDDWWRGWIAQPSLTLYRHDYNAIGLYSLLQRSGVDVWFNLEELIRGQSLTDLIDHAPNPDAFNRLWGTHFANQTDWGPVWDVVGGTNPNVPAPAPEIAVADGPAGTTIAAGELPVAGTDLWATTRTIQTSADVLRITSAPGTNGGFHSGTFSLENLSGINVAVCTKGATCVCPDGFAPDGLMFGATTSGFLGVGPSSAGAKVRFVEQSLDEYCNHCPVAPLSRSGGGGGGLGRRPASTPPDGGVCRSTDVPTAPADNSCAIGTWVSTAWTGSGTSQNAFASGGDGIVMTLGVDGAFHIDYDGMTPVVGRQTGPDGELLEITLAFQGASDGSWAIDPLGKVTGTADARLISIVGTLSVAGQTVPVINATLAELGAGGGGSVPYTAATCSETSLRIETTYPGAAGAAGGTAGIDFTRIG